MRPKISSAEVSQVLSAAGDALRKQASYIENLEGRLERLQRRDDAEKLAHVMHHKGIDTDVPVEQLTERLEKLAEQDSKKFANYQDAVDLVGPDMGTKMAQLDNAEERSGIGGSDLERWLAGQIG
jgi:hypothetical protein